MRPRPACARAGRSSGTPAGDRASSTPSCERGDWILEPAQHEDAFAADPQALWPAVLTRKGGSYALLARMPADPSVN